ncbi:MAG TPA: DNA polymerase III subunit gamma/tau [Actinomycetota bacterium]|jgi:DNA polymerase-3 subunit gamma/tau|nr:DNA polymerase III subunit gamma/tau [Actinomycetota bacterium]
MSYLSLYRRWRPSTFSDVLGQAHVTETLTGAIREDRLSHAYLFSGPRGTGKTSTARILAKALNCEKGVSADPCGECTQCREITEGSSLDVLEMDAASHTSVDDVREIRERIPYATAGGGRKVYIIDEAHQLSNPAFNALLKMLEEPPSHVVFVLCTTEPHRLPATVVSRCQRFEFRRLPGDVLASHLARVASDEKTEVDDDAIALIVRHARGSGRDALSLLDQAAGTAQGKVTREVVLEILGEAPEDVLLDLAEAVSSEDILAVFGKVEELVALGWDPRQLLVQLLEEFRALFLAQRGVVDTGEVDPQHAERRRSLSQQFTSAHLEWVLQALADAQADMRLSTHPRLTLEVALARAANLEVRETQTLVARLERLERALLQGAAPARPAATATPTSAPAKPASPRAKASTPARAKEGPNVPKKKAETAPTPVDGTLEDQWEAVLEAVRSRSRVTHTHLREGWPIEATDDTLTVAFEKDFHATELEKRPDHIERITAVLEGVFGRKLRLETEVRPGERPSTAAAEAEEAASPDDSPVDLVRKGLGGEVVEEVTRS